MYKPEEWTMIPVKKTTRKRLKELHMTYLKKINYDIKINLLMDMSMELYPKNKYAK